MSKIFKGKMGPDGLKKGATYKRGSGGVSYRAAEELVEKFLAVDLVEIYNRKNEQGMYGELADLATLIIEPHNTKEFNPQVFLDAAVLSLSEAGGQSDFIDLRKEPDYLIEPVLQALYNLGHNKLIVDPMHLQYPPTDFGFYLQGEPDNLLTFSYNCSVGWLGNSVKYCKIKTAGAVGKLGEKAENSIFYVNAQITNWTANGEDLKGDWEHLIWLPLQFFDRGNRLFVRQGKGWKELTFEDGSGKWWKRRMKK